jgi:DNA-binding Lrp family transcriptional regulator
MAKAIREGASRSNGRVDELDRALIERLRFEGRASNRSLAAELEVNEATVASRLRRLEEASIMRVVALTDMEAFGHEFLAFAKVRVAGRRLGAVAEDLAQLPECISVTITTGRFDLVVAVLARSRRHLSQLLGMTIPGLGGVDEVLCEGRRLAVYGEPIMLTKIGRSAPKSASIVSTASVRVLGVESPSITRNNPSRARRLQGNTSKYATMRNAVTSQPAIGMYTVAKCKTVVTANSAST